jgi:dipeptidyl aminopeptidase/acylaminoacyl peptidase
MAALLGMEDTRDNSDAALAKYSSRVQAVVDQSGPSDLTTERDPASTEFLAQFLGGDYATHQANWQDASPLFHVAMGDAPFLIVHGTQDQEVPVSQSEELYAKLQAAGVPASFVKVDDGHTFQTPEARRQLAIQSLAFFNRYLVYKK